MAETTRERVARVLRDRGACGGGTNAVMALHPNTLRAMERHVEAGDLVKFLKLARKAGIEEYAGWAVGPILKVKDLRGVNLRGFDLRFADFKGADLRGADLRDTVIVAANFATADLRGADLRGALDGNSWFYRARFDGAKMDPTLREYVGRLVMTGDDG